REPVEGAAGAARPGVRREVGAVVEDARLLAVDLQGGGLALALLVDLHPVGLADLPSGVELPQVGGELDDVRGDPLLVVGVAEVGTQGAAAGVGRVGVDAVAPAPEDAGVGRGEPGEVAAEE